ncbi:hypothetical protein AWB69_00372 [Caballeronia udeis]|uniref:Uncharacterized protein n=1 Tax=Caballeronia udeis TaxID=1232866 RepID=A0A158EY04_9BURK|nr:hypothetical protein [Caballeronia udeis]SAL12383.1 hypothetical protein AWB69_00372 [Caballeronia udeis]
MTHPIPQNIFEKGGADDHSTCLEAHGFLNQSYDSLDHLLRDLAHQGSSHVADSGAVVQLAVVGQPEGLMPFHLFL